MLCQYCGNQIDSDFIQCDKRMGIGEGMDGNAAEVTRVLSQATCGLCGSKAAEEVIVPEGESYVDYNLDYEGQYESYDEYGP